MDGQTKPRTPKPRARFIRAGEGEEGVWRAELGVYAMEAQCPEKAAMKLMQNIKRELANNLAWARHHEHVKAVARERA